MDFPKWIKVARDSELIRLMYKSLYKFTICLWKCSSSIFTFLLTIFQKYFQFLSDCNDNYPNLFHAQIWLKIVKWSIDAIKQFIETSNIITENSKFPEFPNLVKFLTSDAIPSENLMENWISKCDHKTLEEFGAMLISCKFPRSRKFGIRAHWQWLDKVWVPYNSQTCRTVEKAYVKGDSEVSLHFSTSALNVSGYKVNFKTMKQENVRSNFRRDVTRSFKPRKVSYLLWLLVVVVTAKVMNKVMSGNKQNEQFAAYGIIHSKLQEIVQAHLVSEQ